MAQTVKKLKFRGKLSRCYYGKVKVAPGPRGWQRVQLFSDKSASERRLAELQRQADQRQAGMETADTESLKRPITELKDRYIAAFKRERRDQDHIRICDWMLNRLIELGGWRRFSDITRAGMLEILEKLEADGAAVGYRNTYIKRVKAFVHYWLPDNWPDPLRKLRRINEKGAKKARGRFAASPEQVVLLLSSAIPGYRKDCYALMALNSLRRNEAESLIFANGDPGSPGIHLDTEIPYLGIPRKNGQDDGLDYIPLHPFLIARFRAREITPGERVLRNVPDVTTLERDWKAIGVPFTNERGERLDIHALRWTFRTNLGRAGCSRVTIKKLMRHANQDVTDGYGHAELSEMLEGISRLAAPSVGDEKARVGKGKVVSEDSVCADHQLDQTSVILGQSTARTDNLIGVGNTPILDMPACEILRICRAKGAKGQSPTPTDLIASGATDTVEKSRPSTQVD